ncbi:MAG: hypothetical protein ABL995_19310 [Bryobacteraceae bacterium]
MTSRVRVALFTALAVVGSGVVLFQAAAHPHQVPYTFVTVDAPVPGAGSTAVVGINERGDIVGSYNFIPGAGLFGLPPGFLGKGFVWTRNGKFTTIDGPGPVNAASCNPPQSFSNCYYIEARGINDRGDVVGAYTQDVFAQPGGLFHAFVKPQGAAFKSYLFPGHTNTIFQRITDSGLIYGCFHDVGVDDSPQDSMHGITNQLGPNNSIKNVTFSVEPTTMNTGGSGESGSYTGVWYDYTTSRHRAFIMDHGKRTNFDMPGSNMTNAWDMNSSGDVVGVWGNNPDPVVIDGIPFHGFVRDRKGNYVSIDVPNSIDTHVFGINDKGVLVGSYVDQNYNVHGFLAYPGNHERDAALRPTIVNAAFDPSQLKTAAKVVVGMMPVVPNDKPLLRPAKNAMPACHMPQHSK